MGNSEVIAKGKYRYPQSAGVITVANYIIVREDGKKYVLLRFSNERNERVDGLEIKFTQYGADGKEIESSRISFENANGAANSLFVPEERIEVSEECADFRVTILSARYGRYIYKAKKNGVSVDYAPAETDGGGFDETAVKRQMGGRTLSVTRRGFTFSVLMGLAGVILLACLFLFTYLQLDDFKKNADSFSVDRIEYTFIDGNKEPGASVAVTGYNGVVRDITIPAYIEDYKVVEIAPFAFGGNTSLRSVTIEGSVAIMEDAFNGCENLVDFDFSNVTSIGKHAFWSCTSLTAVDSQTVSWIGEEAFRECTSLLDANIAGEEGDNVELGARVFEGCSALENVNISREIIYGNGYLIFPGCLAIKTLSINNLHEDFNGVNTTLILGDMFRNSNMFLEMRELYIGQLSSIPSGFCADMPELSKVTIGHIEDPTIYEDAFCNCTSLTEVTADVPFRWVGARAFQNSGLESFDGSYLRTIADSAFRECYRLNNFDLYKNKSLTSVAENAFRDCTSLEYIYMPAYVTWIGESAFEGCSSLSGIYFAAGALSTIGDSAFEGCSSLTSASIPDSVYFIGDNAFSNCVSLYDVTLPIGLTVINNGLFSGCSSLTSLDIPDYVTEIGSVAFSDCSSLEKIDLPENLSSIYTMAFANCVSLTEAEIPENIVFIGEGVFRECSSLEKLTVPYLGSSYDSEGYLGYIFGVPYVYGQGAYIPETLKTVVLTNTYSVSDICFTDCVYIEEIIFYDGLYSVSDNAFDECYSLRKVTFPDSLVYMGHGAFENLSALEELTLPFLGGSRDGDGYLAYIFGGSSGSSGYVPQSLKTVTLTDVSRIDDYAFYACTAIETINIPDDVTAIGSSAFSDCYKLENFVMPSALTYIGDNSFNNCSSLRAVTLPSTLSFIGDYAFSNCRHLYVVQNLSNLNIVAGNNDYGSVALRAVYVWNAFEPVYVQTAAGDYTFVLADGVWYLIDFAGGQTDVVLPDSFSYEGATVNSYNIPAYLYYSDYEIATLYIPAVVKSIDEFAFAGCQYLTDVTFDENCIIDRINAYVFSSCGSLTSVDIPDTVTLIDNNAFENCGELREVYLPESLEYISYSAFAYCYRLHEVFNYSNLDIRQGSDDNGGVAKYALAVHNTPYAQRLTYYTQNGMTFAYNGNEWYLTGCDDNVTELDLTPFRYMGTYIDSYKIVPYAFYNNDSVQSVNISAAVKEIGEYAFAYSSRLSELTFESAPETVGGWAFFGCSALQNVVLPEGLETIPESMFSSCYALRSVVLPSTLEKIEDDAFAACTSLFEVYNLSSLDITAGSEENGKVANYAVVVYHSLSEESLVAEENYFIFFKSDSGWEVIGYSSLGSSWGTVTMPESFIHGGETITSYAIPEGAFSNTGFDILVIPVSVSHIAEGAFSYTPGTIFYCGTQEQWDEVIKDAPSLADANVYFYVSCVHHDDEWTYDEFGNITNYCYTHAVSIKEPTCTEDGYNDVYCYVCGNLIGTEVIPKWLHSPDENGVCTVCGEQGIFVTSENLADFDCIANDREYPFVFSSDSILSSTNKEDGSKSALTIAATEEMQVIFSCGTSSEYSDRLFVYLNDENILLFNGESGMTEYRYYLSEGDKLEFVYQKDDSVSEGDDCAYITLLLYMTEGAEDAE